MGPKDISIAEYDYDLPESRIAMHPPAQRDASRLLIYKNGGITEDHFSGIDKYLPEETLLVLNNTKVIHTRIIFKKESGAAIEIFCLEPQGPVKEYSSVMRAAGSAVWNCLVGGAAKWKEDLLEKKVRIGTEEVIIHARKKEKLSDSFVIEFSWQPASFSFAEITEASGDMPLPPYIKRAAEETDAERYQTIFAKHEGSVAAPTAGLHFSENIFKKLSEKNIGKAFVTLHVGAGTFKPVKAEYMSGHEMHSEYLDVNIETVRQLQLNAGKIAAVGTTSLRTIESLYWLGVKASRNPAAENLDLLQWEVYEKEFVSETMSIKEALDALLTWMRSRNAENFFTKTQILIAPGYKFRMANMLITNFHQPRSTLLLLVAAAIGDDWKKMYRYALENDLRFLSYGDGNLIFIN